MPTRFRDYSTLDQVKDICAGLGGLIGGGALALIAWFFISLDIATDSPIAVPPAIEIVVPPAQTTITVVSVQNSGTPKKEQQVGMISTPKASTPNGEPVALPPTSSSSTSPVVSTTTSVTPSPSLVVETTQSGADEDPSEPQASVEAVTPSP